MNITRNKIYEIVALVTLGGKVRSKKKALSSKKNGKLGGRKKKSPLQSIV